MVATPLTVVAPSHLAASAAISTLEQNSDVTNGNVVPNDGKTVLLVRNTNAATRNLTVNYGTTYDGQTIPPIVHTVPVTTASVLIALGPSGITGQNVNITYSNGAGGDLKIIPISAGG